MAEGETPGEHVFNAVTEVGLYSICLWVAWYVGGLMRGKFWGSVAIVISVLLFMRAEQCRRETRRAGDYNTGFYIMVPFMCGIILLLRLWLNHR